MKKYVLKDRSYYHIMSCIMQIITTLIASMPCRSFELDLRRKFRTRDHVSTSLRKPHKLSA